MANENAFSAWCIARSYHVERTINNDAVDTATHAERGIHSEIRILIINACSSQAIHDCGADCVRARLNRKPETARVANVNLLAVECDINAAPTQSATNT